MMGIEWGSIADWVSGLGSSAAVITALFLAGSERRVRKLAERPTITCAWKQTSDDGWSLLGVTLHNNSLRSWRVLRVDVLSPRGAKGIAHQFTLKQSSYGGYEFDAHTRNENALRSFPFVVSVSGAGAEEDDYFDGKQNADRASGNIHLMFSRLSTEPLKLKLKIQSLDALPETFYALVVRTLPIET